MGLESTHECKYITWSWLNVKTGETKPFNCGSWSCRQHQGAVAYHWACRVSEAHPERMLTLTNIPHNKQAAYLGFQNLVRDIRNEGMRFEYCRFLEIGHKTGMRHFHLAQRGDFIPVRWLSPRAAANGLGKIVDAEACYGAGPQFYLSKYITKDDFSLPGWRKAASSRHFFPAVKETPADLRDDWVLQRA
ncbi:hypothetical protein ES705_45387 [subsurface metagenome]